MKSFETPYIDFQMFEIKDVLATSGDVPETIKDWEDIPTEPDPGEWMD